LRCRGYGGEEINKYKAKIEKPLIKGRFERCRRKEDSTLLDVRYVGFENGAWMELA
jgi:hypothetical protein